MSSHLDAVDVGFDLSEPIKILDYPKELTLMTEYLNEVQAKQFKETNSIQAFLNNGLNLTVLGREPELVEAPSNIVDSGIRRFSASLAPDAA